ncbi:hypothetical protein ACJJTC_005857 [Scirpophaga incertulas]
MLRAVVILMSLLGIVFTQRPSYAGRIPYGYPELDLSTARTTTTTLSDLFARDKFEVTEQTTTTLQPQAPRRLPIEANGDAALVDRLRRLPVDHQPFWLLNWQALEQLRKRPHSYYVDRNQFIDYTGSRWLY